VIPQPTALTPTSMSATSRTGQPPARLKRYAEAFSADNPTRFWRHLNRDNHHNGPVRCAHPVNSAGPYRNITGRRWRVGSCDGYLEGGHYWLGRPARNDPTARRVAASGPGGCG
jgi:hypothetical protein